jgi:hypothetical protein
MGRGFVRVVAVSGIENFESTLASLRAAKVGRASFIKEPESAKRADCMNMSHEEAVNNPYGWS